MKTLVSVIEEFTALPSYKKGSIVRVGIDSRMEHCHVVGCQDPVPVRSDVSVTIDVKLARGGALQFHASDFTEEWLVQQLEGFLDLLK
jgi:hypothetical protein